MGRVGVGLCVAAVVLAACAPVPPGTSEPASTVAAGAATAPGQAGPSATAGPVPTIRATGRGDGVVTFGVDDAPLLVTVDHRGRGNVVVWALDPQGDESALLVNAIGDYSGTVLAGRGSWGGLRVIAGGRWSVRVADITTARSFTSSAQGRGDEVLAFAGTTPALARFSHGGRGTLTVWLGTDGGSPTLEEWRGDEADVPIEPGLVRIRADGRWAIAVQDALPGASGSAQ